MSTPSPHRVGRYGWVPDLPDVRDHVYTVTRPETVALPPSIDLTEKCPPVYDQGQIGSCTANAIGAAYEFETIKQGLADFMPSRLFIYYNERAMEGHVAFDSGAAIRDGIKSVHKLGVCPETDWPYDDTPAEYDGGPFPASSRAGKKPSDQAYSDALAHCTTAYKRVPRSLDHMRSCLAAGNPFVFGFTVYTSFESPEIAKTGDVPMPDVATESVLGGHAVLAVGYDDGSQRFRVRNSWGKDWGKDGYFTMPYDYLTNRGLSADFWTISGVS